MCLSQFCELRAQRKIWPYDSFIHSDHFYSASSSTLQLRNAPDTAQILCRSFTPKRHRQLWVKDLPKVPTWRLERESNPRPSGLKLSTQSMRHHVPQTISRTSVFVSIYRKTVSDCAGRLEPIWQDVICMGVFRPILGWFLGSAPKWIRFCYRSPKMHRNMPKINGPPHRNPVASLELVSPGAVTHVITHLPCTSSL